MIDEKEKKLNLNGDWIFIKDISGNLKIDDIKNSLNKKNEVETMKVPTNWELAGLHNYNGTIWFIREFDSNFSLENLTILTFLGVDYFADVWLNWNYLGRHEGYFSPFSFDISSTIKSDNILIVKVTSPLEIPGEVWPDHKKLIKGIFNHHDCRPGATSKEFGQDQNTGGIWNDVFIEYDYKIIIENIKAASTFLENEVKAEVKLRIQYYSSLSGENTFPVEFQIISPSGNQLKFKSELEFKAGKNELSYSINISTPELWWSWDLGNPNMYYLNLTSDHFNPYKLKFGIRKIYLDDKQQFFINGKKLFLRGTNIIPTQFLSELDNSKIEKIVSLMKEANINIVRVHAHVNRKEFYEECDKQGILIWQDFSLQWTYDESDSFKENAVAQIKEMVSLLYNHPSIAFWCCHNEPGDQINTLDSLLEEAVKSIDTSRIVRRASNYEEHAYDGWYWGDKEHYAAAPMGPLVTEFGAQALPGLNSLKNFISSDELFPPTWSTWKYHDFQMDQTFNIAKVEIGDSIESFIENSQNYQADVLKIAIDYYRRKRFNGINGVFQFMFIDCWPSVTWSVVDFYGKVKKGYEVLKTAYQPVYISVNLRQNQYFVGSRLLFDLFIINDLYKKFENIFIRFSLNESEIGNFKVESIPINGMIFLNYKLFNYILPENLNAGLHTFYINLICQNSGEKISENNFEFNVIEQP